MKDLAIYGAGGLGREVALLVKQINEQERRWNIVGYFDDAKSKKDLINGIPVLGGIADLNALVAPVSVVVAIARSSDRRQIVEQIVNGLIDFPILIHPNANVGGDNALGRGTVITAGCILTTNISIGEFCIINLSCTIGHDVSVGDYTSVMPSTNISGAVRIGEGCLLGTGCKILQNLSIGKAAIVGAGAVVTKDVPANTTVVGVPARDILLKMS